MDGLYCSTQGYTRVCICREAGRWRCMCIQVNGYVNEFCGVGLNGRCVDV